MWIKLHSVTGQALIINLDSVRSFHFDNINELVRITWQSGGEETIRESWDDILNALDMIEVRSA